MHMWGGKLHRPTKLIEFIQQTPNSTWKESSLCDLHTSDVRDIFRLVNVSIDSHNFIIFSIFMTRLCL